MKRIIVATDLSVNSKAGVRFAIQLASQTPVFLIFFHVIQLLVPARWNDVKVRIHLDEEIKEAEIDLSVFLKKVFKEANVRPKQFECVVRYGSPVYEAIIEYGKERNASFICVSTRGAGRIRRVLGTHTSALVKNSPIPVLVAPKNYKRMPINHIMYASDLTDIKNELRKVRNFATSINGKVSVLHYDYFLQIRKTKPEFDRVVKRYDSPGVDFHLQKFNLEKPLAAHIKKAIRKFKPSLVALFTKQDRNWYQRIFLSSKSADVTYDTRKPLVVFPRKRE